MLDQRCFHFFLGTSVHISRALGAELPLLVERISLIMLYHVFRDEKKTCNLLFMSEPGVTLKGSKYLAGSGADENHEAIRWFEYTSLDSTVQNMSFLLGGCGV